MPGTHALLSPSAAHRWLHCTASPMLGKDVVEMGSIYAEEGTLAHAYCAKKLKKFLKLSTEEEDKEIAELDKLHHSGEMDEHTDAYKTIVLEKFNAARAKTADAQLLVEVKLDFSRYVPDSFGTSDAIIIADGCMEVIDFKYGKGVEVSAVENPQMMIYALGAWDRFNFEYDIDRVKMTIVQPRLDNLSEYEVSVGDLLDWSEKVLEPKAKEAYEGGRQEPGDWCRFCKVKAKCAALAIRCAGAWQCHPYPELISQKVMAASILPMLPAFKTWLDGIEKFTLEQALSGVKYEGYKLVEGRSVRKITDPDAVMNLLNDKGYDEADFLKPVELRGITDLEKLVGKKAFGTLCKDYINKPKGKPTLVPESDKRGAIDPAQDDFKDI